MHRRTFEQKFDGKIEVNAYNAHQYFQRASNEQPC